VTCRTGCRTKDHASWGECARQSGMQVGDLGRGVAATTDRRLNAYADARKQGIQPQGTQEWQTRLAVEKADRTGVAA
jgi:hypothetical protein